MGESKTKPIKQEELTKLLSWLGTSINEWLEDE